MAKRIYKFSQAEKDQIEGAVKRLEKESSGEIVPYFVPASDAYVEASWYCSTILTAFTSIAIGAQSYFWLLPFRLTPLEVCAVILLALVLGFLFPIVFPVAKRWIVSSSIQEERVKQRAMQAFISEEVFNTKERVGILIFVSQLEHMVLVEGDEGINQKVQQSDWEHIVETVVDSIHNGEIGNGLEKAIDQCKELLLHHGFVRKSTDTNELDDSFRIEED